MAKVKGALSELTGSIGDLVFVRRGNQTYAYEKPDKKDAKSYRQMLYRTRWANALYTYRAFGKYLCGAFENKDDGKNDYNRFMSLNVGYPIFLTKKDKEQYVCIAAPYQISEGSLQSIEVSEADETTLCTNIRIGDLIIDQDTTVSALTEAICRNNVGFSNDDKIVFFQSKQERDNVALRKLYVRLDVDVVKLDYNTSIRVLDMAPVGFENIDGYLGARNLKDGCFCWVHTRRIHPKLPALVSTQHLINMNKELVSQYSSKEAMMKAAKSYGVKHLDDILTIGEGSSRKTIEYPFK